MAQAAAATAKTLTATTFSANVALVTAAFGSSVAAPNASSITVISPVVSGGASGSSSSSDDGNGAVIGGSIGGCRHGAVAFIIIVAFSTFSAERTPARTTRVRSKDDSDRKDAPTPKRTSGRREQAWTEGLAPPPGPGTLTSTTLHKGRVIHSPSFNFHWPRQRVRCSVAPAKT
jgi:hypothetical protein